MTRIAAPLAMLALLGACTPAPPPPFPAVYEPVPPASGEGLTGRSRNAIIGHVAVRLSDGNVATCAGGPVRLIAANAATRRRMDAIYGEDNEMVLNSQAGHPAGAAPRVAQQTRCDARGRFRFDNVPDGRYFVTAPVRGPEPASFRRDVSVSGGVRREVAMER